MDVLITLFIANVVAAGARPVRLIAFDRQVGRRTAGLGSVLLKGQIRHTHTVKHSASRTSSPHWYSVAMELTWKRCCFPRVHLFMSFH